MKHQNLTPVLNCIVVSVELFIRLFQSCIHYNHFPDTV